MNLAPVPFWRPFRNDERARVGAVPFHLEDLDFHEGDRLLC
jgi:hypothetical protein